MGDEPFFTARMQDGGKFEDVGGGAGLQGMRLIIFMVRHASCVFLPMGNRSYM